MHGDPMPGGQVANGGRIQAGHGEPAIAFWTDGRPTAGEQPGELTGPGRAHQHVLARTGHEPVGGGVSEQPAAPDDDQVIGGQRDLAHQMAGDQDGAALGGHRLQQLPDPADARGV